MANLNLGGICDFVIIRNVDWRVIGAIIIVEICVALFSNHYNTGTVKVPHWFVTYRSEIDNQIPIIFRSALLWGKMCTFTIGTPTHSIATVAILIKAPL